MGLDLAGAFDQHEQLILGDDIYQSWHRRPLQEVTA
jgi:hypothetical protein